MSLFAELKRRKVFKVGAAYLVVAWLAVQAAPVMAWVFDVTREGVKLEFGASGSKGLFAVAALLIVLALGWYFYGQPSFRKGDAATPTIAGHNSIAVLPFANISATRTISI